MVQYWAQKITGKTGTVGLVPTTADTEGLFARLDSDKPCRVEVKQPRNGKHHRKYWAILGEVADNTEMYADSRAVHEAILLRLKMYDAAILTATDGSQSVTIRFHSISYAQKDQAEFAAFYERAMDVIAGDLGFDIEELERMIE